MKQSIVSKIILTILVLGVGVISLFLGVSFWSNRQEDRNKRRDNISEIEDQEPVDALISQEPEMIFDEFEGRYIKAKIPKHWQIIEYIDGENKLEYPPYWTGMNVEYIGLTGLSIITPNEKKIFAISIADGIGGSGECPEINKFADTSLEFVKFYETVNSHFDGFQYKVVDLTGVDFTDFTFLSQKGRRVANQIYWNTRLEGYNGFNPDCSDVGQINLEIRYSFKDRPEMVLNSYVAFLDKHASEEEYEELDEILRLIRSKNG